MPICALWAEASTFVLPCPQTLVLKLEKEREDALAAVKQLTTEGADLREVWGGRGEEL